MKRTGSHHLGLATYDYEGIVDFYTRVLGWEIAWQDLMTGPDGTVHMKHVFFDTGDGSYGIGRRTGTTAGPAPRAQPSGDRNHRSWVG